MRILMSSALGALLIQAAAAAQEPVAQGDQFQINSYTTNSQKVPDLTMDDQGDFVVVWQSDGSFGTDAGYSIQAQRFDANGTSVGGQFQVNSFTTSLQFNPAVASNPQGNFVVVWTSAFSAGTDTDSYSVQGQLFDASGAPVGGEFQVNSYTTSWQHTPGVAVDAQGNFVVTWESNGSYGTDTTRSIQGQRYNANGSPVGVQFQVNSYTSGAERHPAVGVDAQGNFVVVWQSNSHPSDPSDYSVQAQRFDTSGTPVEGQFQVNSYTTGRQYNPEIAVDSQGNFVVVWTSEGSAGTDTDSYSIQGQLFDASGTPMGEEFQVNSYTPGQQVEPAVSLNTHGEFVVAWRSDVSYGTDIDWSIQGQLYDASGAPVAGQFQVNSYTTSFQTLPRLALDAQDNFVVVWESRGASGTDTDGDSVHGQRFAIPVFADSFESGDMSAWSDSVL